MTPDSVFEACHICVNAYLMARTYAECMRERVDKVQREILAEAPLDMDPQWIEKGRPDEKITDPKHTYLGTDLHFKDYIEECNHRLKKLGIKPADMPDEHCPALSAEHLRVQAEWLLLEVGWGAIGQGNPHDWKLLYGDNRKKFIDLMVGLVVNHPKYERPKI